jgi:hypothetical protein
MGSLIVGWQNEWSDLPLVEWGVDLPEDWLKNILKKRMKTCSDKDLIFLCAFLLSGIGLENVKKYGNR